MDPSSPDIYALVENASGILYSFCIVITFFHCFFWGLYGR